ncbi:response regulator [Pediococcus siamensis]|uniref:response regulator n=1 Tax=Pediococcus siamensis TaxID=381829 RepID=UPI0039A3D086
MASIIIVDNHPIFREGLEAAFIKNVKYKIVAEADTGAQALQTLESTTIDIMLLDLLRPLVDGMATLEHVKKQFPQVKVIVLTAYEDISVFSKAMELHADGFLLKSATAQHIFKTIDEVMTGKVVVSPEVLKNVAIYQNAKYTLSNADLEILTRIAKGEHSSKIAQELHFSERTVKGHLTNIYGILDVDSRAAAVAKAMQFNLIKL